MVKSYGHNNLLGVDFKPGQNSDIGARLPDVTAVNQPRLSGGFTCQFSPEIQPFEIIPVDGLPGLDSSGDRWVPWSINRSTSCPERSRQK